MRTISKKGICGAKSHPERTGTIDAAGERENEDRRCTLRFAD